MTFIQRLFLFLLSVSILGISSGCASLPDVAEKMDEVPTAREARQIASASGMLSPTQSKAIMDRLKRSVPPTDILERHVVVVESVTANPLTKGNKVNLPEKTVELGIRIE